jgi:hypothetical protein
LRAGPILARSLQNPNGARGHAAELLDRNRAIRERRDEFLALRAEANLTRVHEIAVAAHCTLEAHLAKLAELRDQAQLAGKYGEAISAEVNRGKALGFYVARSEAGRPGEFSNLSDAELDAKIAALSAIHKAKNPGPQTPAADA